MDGDDEDIRNALVRWGELDADELSRVQVYRGYRRQRELHIEILDAGVAGPFRWNAIVTDLQDGKQVSGNGAPNPDEALAIVHWNELNEPPPSLPDQ